jgi:hypothetical protein
MMQSEKQPFDFQKGEILVFDKPLNWTSFDLVHKVRYIICKKLNIKSWACRDTRSQSNRNTRFMHRKSHLKN